VEGDADRTEWHQARFLKATADDASRAPHALEYILDYRLGEPGLKAFRSFAVRAREGEFLILPGIDAHARPVTFATPVDSRLPKLEDGEPAIVFGYLEPWSRDWVVVDVKPTDSAGCLVHAMTWADFQAELRGAEALSAADLSAVRGALLGAGLDSPPPHELVGEIPRRQLTRATRALLRWLRYRI
jgi:hypothetical protein